MGFDFIGDCIRRAQVLETDTSKPLTVQSSHGGTEVVSAEDQILLNEATPLCNMALGGFLNAKTPEERSQFVSSPINTTGRMENFYSINPLENIDSKTITIQNAVVAHLPGENAIEFCLGSADGRLLDVAFVKENDEWKIDWDHFVRYSEIPWPLFLAGGGDSEGEFRLLARERLAEERKNAATISLVLYAPRFGYARETGFQSPEFIVSRNSRDGRLLDAAFELERSQKRPFGVNLPNVNLEGLIRVRVKIRRETADQTRRFEIEKVVACHWYAIDDPGVIIPDDPVKNEGETSKTKSPEAPASSPEAAPSQETNAGTPKPLDE